MIKVSDVISAIETLIPPALQESWDNTGWQIVDDKSRECSGVLTCLDITDSNIEQACKAGCNLIISHHPLIYKPLQRITGENRCQKLVYKTIRDDLAVYSAHTSLDSASEIGLSLEMARQLGIKDVKILEPHSPEYPHAGLGIIGSLKISASDLVNLVKKVYSQPTLRVSMPQGLKEIRKVALCTGAGHDFIQSAITQGADAYISSDLKYHDMLDFSGEIMLIDTGHYESEICASQVLYNIIRSAFPELKLIKANELNVVKYL